MNSRELIDQADRRYKEIGGLSRGWVQGSWCNGYIQGWMEHTPDPRLTALEEDVNDEKRETSEWQAALTLAEAEVQRLRADNRRLREAGEALLVMMDYLKPRKLDEALTWKENDEKSRQMMEAALAFQEQAQGKEESRG